MLEMRHSQEPHPIKVTLGAGRTSVTLCATCHYWHFSSSWRPRRVSGRLTLELFRAWVATVARWPFRRYSQVPLAQNFSKMGVNSLSYELGEGCFIHLEFQAKRKRRLFSTVLFVIPLFSLTLWCPEALLDSKARSYGTEATIQTQRRSFEQIREKMTKELSQTFPEKYVRMSVCLFLLPTKDFRNDQVAIFNDSLTSIRKEFFSSGTVIYKVPAVQDSLPCALFIGILDQVSLG